MPTVRLYPMTDAERLAFAERQVIEYARQQVEAGEWPAADATRLAREGIPELLAGGDRLAGHLLLSAVNDADEDAGWLWILPRPAFLADVPGEIRWLGQIIVAPLHRRQGYGRAMLHALHARLAADGIDELWLRVYDWNAPARRLYESLGYELARRFDTDRHLRRRLP